MLKGDYREREEPSCKRCVTGVRPGRLISLILTPLLTRSFLSARPRVAFFCHDSALLSCLETIQQWAGGVKNVELWGKLQEVRKARPRERISCNHQSVYSSYLEFITHQFARTRCEAVGYTLLALHISVLLWSHFFLSPISIFWNWNIYPMPLSLVLNCIFCLYRGWQPKDCCKSQRRLVLSVVWNCYDFAVLRDELDGFV